MVELNSQVWKELHSEDIPSLLRDLAEKPTGERWETLNEALVDQGDVCSAAYAAVPHLIEIAIVQPVAVQVDFWELIGYIASQQPQYLHGLPNEVRSDYAASLTKAKSHLLKAIQARMVNEERTVSLIEVLAAVSGCYGPGRILKSVVYANELGADCSVCNRILKIRFHEEGLVITSNLTGKVSKQPRIETPANGAAQGAPTPDEITSDLCYVWLPQVAEAVGHSGVAQRIRTLYQDVTCPECNCQFPLMEELCKEVTVDIDDSNLESDPQEAVDPQEREAIERQIEKQTAQVNFFYKLEALPKAELIRTLLVISEIELYEGSFTAEVLSNAEAAMSAAREWLKKPSAPHEEKARLAGSQALKLVAGAAATACGRMPELAAKTCVDALMGLPLELREMAIARIQEIMSHPQ